MRITNDSQPSVQLVLQVVIHPIPNHDSLDSLGGVSYGNGLRFVIFQVLVQRPAIPAVSPLGEVGELEDSMGINGETWGPTRSHRALEHPNASSHRRSPSLGFGWGQSCQ